METNFYLTVAIIWAIAAVTPGPNFFITIQTAIGESYKKSVFTISGIVAGTFIWAISGYFGVTIIFKTVPLFYYCLKIIGGLYLIYLGANLLFRKKKAHFSCQNSNSLSSFHCFRQGALTNLLNPKTAAFMTSLFAAAIPPNHTLETGILSVALICFISALWYSLVATLFSKRIVRGVYENYKIVIERLAGVIFIFFGLKLAFSK